MGKARHGTKEAKKQPLLTAKEKRAAKQAKKHEAAVAHPPLVTR